MKFNLLENISPSNHALFIEWKTPDFFPFFPDLISIFYTFSRSGNLFADFHTFSRIPDSVRNLLIPHRHGAWAWFSHGTRVNTLVFQGPVPKFSCNKVAISWWWYLRFPVSEHTQYYFALCPGTSAVASSVKNILTWGTSLLTTVWNTCIHFPKSDVISSRGRTY